MCVLKDIRGVLCTSASQKKKKESELTRGTSRWPPVTLTTGQRHLRNHRFWDSYLLTWGQDVTVIRWRGGERVHGLESRHHQIDIFPKMCNIRASIDSRRV